MIAEILIINVSVEGNVNHVAITDYEQGNIMIINQLITSLPL